MTKWYLKWIVKIPQQRMFLVFIADDAQFLGDLPVDRQIGVVQHDTTVRFGMVEVIAFIGKDSLLAQHGETVRKTARDEELPFVLFAQFDAEPLTKSRAVLAQVNRHVQHAAYGAAYQLRLAVRRALKMQSAYYTVTRTRLVILHKLRINSRLAVTLFVVRLYEITTGIREHSRLNDQQSLNRCFDYIHGLKIKSGTNLQQFFHIRKSLSIFLFMDGVKLRDCLNADKDGMLLFGGGAAEIATPRKRALPEPPSVRFPKRKPLFLRSSISA